VVTVHGALDDGDKPVFGVASVGRRPTVDGKDERIETYLLDFDGDLYGRRIHVHFHHKLREELKFSSLEELKAAMAKDIADARRYFGI
jgi:riboflavin kinase/FMN adenylyltransferase